MANAIVETDDYEDKRYYESEVDVFEVWSET